MKKQRRLTVEDLPRVAVTPVENKSGYESGPELWNRLKAEEKAAQDASERAAYLQTPQGQHETLIQQNEKSLRKFWSLPWSQLREFERRHFPVDFIGDYTLMTSESTFQEEAAIVGQFLDALEARGITFPENDECRPGLLRFLSYFTSLRQRAIAMTPENLMQALQRFVYGLRAYEPNPGELSGTVPKPEWAEAPKAAPQETENERRARLIKEGVENVDTSTREGRAKATAVLDNLWGADVRNRYREFSEFMDATYGVDVMTDKICREYGSFCDRFNLNPIAATTLNAWRRELDRRRYFAGSLLTPDEKIAASLEASDLSSREVKQHVARRIREANPTR